MARNFQTGLIITGDANGAIQATRLTEQALQRLNGTANETRSASERLRQQILNNDAALRGYSQTLDIAQKALYGVAGAIGVLSFAQLIRDIVQTNVAFETMRIRLNNLFNDAKVGAYEFRQAMDLAFKSPLELRDVTQGFIQLKTYGIEPTRQVMGALLDMSARMGNGAISLTTLTDQLGQAWSKGKLQMVDMKIMMEAGAPVLDLLTKMFGKSSDEIMKMSESGEMGRDTIYKLIQAMGEFSNGSQIAMMDTMAGRWSMLTDSVHKFFDELMGKNTESFLKDFMQWLSQSIDELTQKVTSTPGFQKQIEDINERINYFKNKVQRDVDSGIAINKDAYNARLAALEHEKELIFAAADKQRASDAAIEAAMQNKNELAAKAASIANEGANAELDTQKKIDQILNGRYREQIISGANKYGVDPNFMLAVAQQETASGANIAISGAGAQGLMQIMPSTAEGLARQMHTTTDAVLHDIQTNADAAALYVKQKMTELQGSGRLTVENLAAAYNAGFGNLQKAKFNLAELPKPSETIPYAKSVADSYAALSKYGADSFKEIADNAKKATDEQKKFDDEGKRIKESLDPLAKFNTTYQSLSAQLKAGNISQTDFTIGMDSASDALARATTKTETLTDAQRKANDIIEAAKSPWDKWAESINSAGIALAQGLISTDVYNTYTQKITENFQKQQDQLSNSIEKSNVYGNALQALENQKLQILGTDREQYAASLDLIDGQHKLTQAEKDNLLALFDQNAALKTQKDLYHTLFQSAATAFDNMLTKGQSFADSLKSVFDNMVSAIRSKLLTLAENSFMNNNWGSLAANVAGIALTYLPQLLTQSAPKLQTSLSSKSTGTGSGAMSIADNIGLSAGNSFDSITVKNYNNQIQTMESAIWSAGKSVFADVGSKILSSASDFFSPLTNAISGLFSGSSSVFAAELSSSVAGSGLTTAISNAITPAFESAAQNASATVAKSAVGDIAGTAGKVLGAIGAIYSVFSYFDSLGGLIKQGNIQAIAGNTIALAGALYGFFVNPILGGVIAAIGALISLFSKPRIPNYWINTFNPANSAENPNKSTAAYDALATKQVYIDGKVIPVNADGTYYSTGNKSATAGVITPFGATQFSSHEMSNSIDDIKQQFGGLLGYIKTFDVGLTDAVNKADQNFGQAGQTMQAYDKWLGDMDGNRIAMKQNASKLDTGALISDRYTQIIDQLNASGTQGGELISTWYHAFADKLSKTDKDYQSQIFSIIGGISSNIDEFLKLPVSLAKMVGESVKAGTSFNDQLKSATEVIGTYQAVVSGFDKLGAHANQDAIVTFLSSMNSISDSVTASGASLLSFADAMRALGKDTDIGQAAVDKYNQLIAKGANNDQITAYFTSAGPVAQALAQMKASFTDADLGTFADKIYTLSSATQQAAKDVVDHAIADQKLGNMSREAALQLLINNKTLDAATVANSEYAGSVKSATQSQLEGLQLVQTVLAGTGTSLENLGISAGQLPDVIQTLTNRFGDMKTAAQQLADFITTAFGSSAATQYSNNQAYSEMQAILDRNPEMAKYGLYAGMNSQNLQDANIAASNVTGISLNDIIAGSTKLMVSNPDLQRFVTLAGTITSNQSKSGTSTGNGGYKFSTDFSGSVGNSGTGSGSGSTDNYKLDPFLADSTHTITTTSQDIAKAADVAATSLADLMKPFQDSSATQGMSEYQKKLYELNSAFNENIQKATALGASESQLATIRSAHTADIKDQFKDIYTEFLNLGKTDYQKSLGGIKEWANNMIAVAPQIASAYGASVNDVLNVIDQIKSARLDALNKEKQSIIDNAQSSYESLKNTANNNEIQNTYNGIVADYGAKLTSLIAAGGDLNDIMTLLRVGFFALSSAADTAKKQVTDSFIGIFDSIKSKQDAIADNITKIKSGDQAVTQQQLNRALSVFGLPENTTSVTKEQLASYYNSYTKDFTQDQLRRYYDQQMSAAESLQNLVMQNYQEQMDAVKKIGDYLDSLQQGDLSILSPKEKMDAAGAKALEQYNLAKAGNTNALSNITSYADTYLKSAKDYYGSTEAYATVYNDVTAKLKDLAGLDARTVAEKQLDIQTKSVGYLQSIDTILSTIKEQQTTQQTNAITNISTSLETTNRKILEYLQLLADSKGLKIDVSSLNFLIKPKTTNQTTDDSLSDAFKKLFGIDGTQFKQYLKGGLDGFGKDIEGYLKVDAFSSKYAKDAKDYIEGGIWWLGYNIWYYLKNFELDSQKETINKGFTQLANHIYDSLDATTLDSQKATMDLGFSQLAKHIYDSLDATTLESQKATMDLGFTQLAMHIYDSLDTTTLESQKATMDLGFTQLAKHIYDSLDTTTLESQKATMDLGFTQLAKHIYDSLDTTTLETQKAKIDSGFTQLAKHIYDSLDNTDLASQKTTIDQGFGKLAQHISDGLDAMSVDGSGIQTSVNTLMGSIAGAISAISVQTPTVDTTSYKGNGRAAAELPGVSWSDGSMYAPYQPMQMFALGGIANQPAIFGESGPEAAVPLPDGRTIPVTLTHKGGSDNGNNEEVVEQLKQTVQELRAQNQHLIVMINDLRAGFRQNNKDNQKQIDSLESLESTARMNA